jgi:uronate dehydrogenase
MTILLTGASGGVGTFIRPLLRERYGDIRLSDQTEPDDLQSNETFVAADLADFEATQKAVEGIDHIVHLGGFSVEGPWPTILNSNIIGTYNLFEAARLAGSGRIIFASSNHAVGYYERSDTIDANVPVRPDSRYGVSKVFGEAMGAMYADKHGLQVCSLRIGNVGLAPLDRRRLSIWVHPEDLMQLIHIGLTHPDIHCDVLYAMSDNKRAWWDNSRATQLGYKPAHKSEDFAAEILAREEQPDAIADRYQGGTFAAAEHTRKISSD